ncbi:helix-turn-helix domain-containing protein [Devosia sp. Root105]|uniref:winged helix-turn-helix transcriptional regulator n=1 Tax=Devosia sp. Root105 TaxID=1736423 RepID=UPI0009E6D4A8|nr:helix-turn-helix domain-containing protein [Devosia sp. Root105]
MTARQTAQAQKNFPAAPEKSVTAAKPLETVDGAAHCKATGQVLDLIGDKWTIMVVGVLSRGPTRFNEIMRAVGGVSHRMLTLTLRGLVRNGLVSRTPFATIPPRVDYELTELGRSLIEPLKVMSGWAMDNGAALEQAKARYDTAQSSEQ